MLNIQYALHSMWTVLYEIIYNGALWNTVSAADETYLVTARRVNLFFLDMVVCSSSLWPAKFLRFKMKFTQTHCSGVTVLFFAWHNIERAVQSTNSWGLYKVNRLKWMHRTIYWGGRCEVLVVNHKIVRVWVPMS
jgi:hypothetical protein